MYTTLTQFVGLTSVIGSKISKTELVVKFQRQSWCGSFYCLFKFTIFVGNLSTYAQSKSDLHTSVITPKLVTSGEAHHCGLVSGRHRNKKRRSSSESLVTVRPVGLAQLSNPRPTAPIAVFNHSTNRPSSK